MNPEPTPDKQQWNDFLEAFRKFLYDNKRFILEQIDALEIGDRFSLADILFERLDSETIRIALLPDETNETVVRSEPLS